MYKNLEKKFKGKKINSEGVEATCWVSACPHSERIAEGFGHKQSEQEAFQHYCTVTSPLQKYLHVCICFIISFRKINHCSALLHALILCPCHKRPNLRLEQDLLHDVLLQIMISIVFFIDFYLEQRHSVMIVRPYY